VVDYQAELLEALRNLLEFAEAAEQQIENEWGRNRTLAELKAGGILDENIVQARAIIAEVEGQTTPG